MNIKELQSYFGEWNGLRDNRARALQFDDCGAYGNFGDLRLYSVFQPIVSRLDGHTAAHEALLRARNSRNVAVTPAAAFELPESSAAVVYLDRLCRMVHAVNFFHLGEQRGDLFLNVDFRHVLSVESGDHGRTMETLLGHCGLTPTQVVLEVIESHIDHLALLEQAILGYRRRGFRVAIDDFGAQDSNFDRLWRLTPDVVKIDRTLVVEATRNPRARRILPKIVDIIHELGATVVCEGIETCLQDELARDSGADLLQGFLYGRPSSLAAIDRRSDESGWPVFGEQVGSHPD